MRLTKSQLKSKDRINAWMGNLPFKETARDKARIPELSVAEVLRDYVPEDIESNCKYFTPDEAAYKLLHVLPELGFEGTPRTLEPCAGIGHLVHHMLTVGMDVTAVELSTTDCTLGNRLFPDAHWLNLDALTLPNRQDIVMDGFDMAVMNPPFGKTPYIDDTMPKYLGKKSQDIFLELAVRVLKPGGYLLMIGSWNAISGVPKGLKTFLDARIEFVRNLGELPGRYRFAGITTQGFLLRKNKNVVHVKESITGTDQWALVVPLEIHEQLQSLPFALSPDWKATVDMLNGYALFAAAEYVKKNSKQYGYLYYYGTRAE